MAVRVEVEDGPSGQACCLRCAITYSRQTGKTVRVDWVTDHVHGQKMAADRAVYVVGSNVAPCAAMREVAPADRRELLTEIWDRCRTSTIAFADVADARAFQALHGGAIETFGHLVSGVKVVAGRTG
jgi:nitrous oxide reductase accessory protein NosL